MTSPRTWGWTASYELVPVPEADVPTHVGVDLVAHAWSVASSGRPHARGGGPNCRRSAGTAYWTSPRTWGWTSTRAGDRVRIIDVPTHVGVDLDNQPGEERHQGRPHARGGGPSSHWAGSPAAATSPRTWGWTARRFRRRRVMARRPHARGGGPPLGSPPLDWWETSPRTWGWTQFGGGGPRVDGDVPTHVGVDRAAIGRVHRRRRRPHARGGGPSTHSRPTEGHETSPRTWGWTRGTTAAARNAGDVPTHVGVDRRKWRRAAHSTRPPRLPTCAYPPESRVLYPGGDARVAQGIEQLPPKQ